MSKSHCRDWKSWGRRSSPCPLTDHNLSVRWIRCSMILPIVDRYFRSAGSLPWSKSNWGRACRPCSQTRRRYRSEAWPIRWQRFWPDFPMFPKLNSNLSRTWRVVRWSHPAGRSLDFVVCRCRCLFPATSPRCPPGGRVPLPWVTWWLTHTWRLSMRMGWQLCTTWSRPGRPRLSLKRSRSPSRESER